jgi:hypothetical protein
MTPTANATLYVRFGSNWRGPQFVSGDDRCWGIPPVAPTAAFWRSPTVPVLIGKDGKGSIPANRPPPGYFRGADRNAWNAARLRRLKRGKACIFSAIRAFSAVFFPFR